MTTASEHPPTCQQCHGTGYERGPDAVITDLHGNTLRTYTTVQPCTHHWTNDEPQHDELISVDEYLHRHPDQTHKLR